MKQTAFLGIDPGASGAVALITPDTTIVEPWPGDPVAAADLLRGWVAQYSIRMAALERVASRPGQGVASVFSFGANFGTWQGILAALAIPYTMPTPQQWQKGLIVNSDGPGKHGRWQWRAGCSRLWTFTAKATTARPTPNCWRCTRKTFTRLKNEATNCRPPAH